MKLSILDQVRTTSGVSDSQTLHNSIELAQLGDELGYERYWVAEHHGSERVACSCPEVLLGRIGGETSTIRIGAGGILLPHYSPLKVAETFHTLEALYPNRIDLGIGRAPGCNPPEVRALKRYRVEGSFGEDFEEQLTELLCLLNASFPVDHPFHEVRVSPRINGDLPVWLLGSSVSSAAVAAKFGLPFAFAQFICPTSIQDPFEFYRREFHSNENAFRPTTILAVGAVCVDTESKVQELAASARQNKQQPSPRSDVRSPTLKRNHWERFCFVGTPDTVRNGLLSAAAVSNADEVMVLAPFGDHETCLQSYQLLAKAFALKRRRGCSSAGHCES